MRGRLITLAIAAALAGCAESEPPAMTEVPAASCTSQPTGQTGVRIEKRCVTIGKNACGSTRKIEHATEELRTSCNFTHWRDK